MSEHGPTSSITVRLLGRPWVGRVSAALVGLAVVAGLGVAVSADGHLPTIQPGYGAAGERAYELNQLVVALAIAVNERHVLRYNLGVALMREGRAAEALEQFELALRRRPDFGLALRDLGKLLAERARQTGQAADAERSVQLLQAATTALPEDAEAWFQLGNALGRMRRWPAAVAAWQRASALGAPRPDVWHNLGTGLATLRQLPDAQAAFERALAIDPGYQRSRAALDKLRAMAPNP